MLRRADTPPLTRGVVVRGAIFALAVALGAVAVWLIVTSTTQKRIELGILAGLWGLLLGTFSMLGNRRALAVPSSHLAESRAEDVDATDAGPALAGSDAAAAGSAGAALELRSAVALEREADAEERRAWQARFEQLMRHEVRDAMSDEVSSLRAEIASLRGELLEKVGGQLRLERIETTRLIGSDLEALQHEVRQLKVAADGAEFTDASDHRIVSQPYTRSVVEPAQTRPVTRHTADVESDIQPARRPEPMAQAPAAEPAPSARPEPPPPRPSPPPDDDFATLPRLSPFTDVGPEPAEREAPAPAPNNYSGRRRRQDEQDAERQRAGRHADRSTGRRHRRDDEDDEGDDALTRPLSRDAAH